MKIKSFLTQTIKQYAFKRGLIVEWVTAKGGNRSQLEAFFPRFREKYVSVNLTRIGGQGDGGYLVPDCLDDIKYCFSAGVADVADFEQDLSDKYNIKSFMADGSVERAPVQGDNFEFMKEFIGNPPANSQQPTANRIISRFLIGSNTRLAMTAVQKFYKWILKAANLTCSSLKTSPRFRLWSSNFTA